MVELFHFGSFPLAPVFPEPLTESRDTARSPPGAAPCTLDVIVKSG